MTITNDHCLLNPLTQHGVTRWRLEPKQSHDDKPGTPSGPDDGRSGTQAVIDAEAEDDVTQPPMYRVVLLNDDFTPMEFVVLVLVKFFAKSEAAATALMLEVHQKGRAVVGVYSKEIAETKAHLVNTFSRQHEFPLLCQYEKD
jgi:ATP-dependent Clp protease adaptor protein ClpS